MLITFKNCNSRYYKYYKTGYKHFLLFNIIITLTLHQTKQTWH